MDIFTFCPGTDTFGKVVLEALTPGVPAVVTDKESPDFIIDNKV
jgi:hypothetical protein